MIHRLLGDACDIYGMKWSDLCKECTKLVIDDSIKTIGIGSFCGNDLSFDEVEIHCYKGGTTYVDIRNLKRSFNLFFVFFRFCKNINR